MRPPTTHPWTGRIAAAGSLVLAVTALAPTSSAIPWTATTVATHVATDGGVRAGDGAGAEVDLRQTGVFTMTNALGQNRVVALAMVNGELRKVGSFATGGTGSGGFEDTANGLILGSSRGESAPNNLISDRELLFATNAGSNNVSVFRVRKERLQRVEVQYSRGMKPVSVTVNRGVVYVLNNGEVKDGLPTHPNCTTGRRPSLTGFRVSPAGELTPIPNSKRLLSGDPFSGCAQVSFTPSGDHLVVTERLAITAGEVPADEGRINTYAVRSNGTLGRHRVIDATGQGPFGFGFTKSGTLLTAEQFDGPDGQGRGAAAAYRINADGSLDPTSKSVHNGGTDTCWFVVTDDGRYGFTASFFGPGRLSSYRIGADGSLRLLQAKAAGARVKQGASDLSLSGDSRFLYSLNSVAGTVTVFRVDGGDLRFVDVVRASRPSANEARIGLASS